MAEKTKKVKNKIVRRYISVLHEWEAKEISERLNASFSTHQDPNIDGRFGRRPPVHWIRIPDGKLSLAVSICDSVCKWSLRKPYKVIRVTDDGRFV